MRALICALGLLGAGVSQGGGLQVQDHETWSPSSRPAVQAPRSDASNSVIDQLDRERRVAAQRLRSSFVSVTLERPFPLAPVLVSGTLLDEKGRFVVPTAVLEETTPSRIFARLDCGARCRSRVVLSEKGAPLTVLEVVRDAAATFDDAAPRTVRPAPNVLEVGDSLVVVTNSLGLEATTAFGYVSGVQRRIPSSPTALIQASFVVSPGMPGGPVGNGSGDLAGILLGGPNWGADSELTANVANPDAPLPAVATRGTGSAKADSKDGGERIGREKGREAEITVVAPSTGSQTLRQFVRITTTGDLPPTAFVVPIADARAMLDRIPAGVAADPIGDVPLLGVVMNEIVDPLLRSQLRLPDGIGLVIEDVIEATPAQRAGLRVHDILLRADGESLRHNSQMRPLLRAAAARGVLRLEILRLGAAREIEVHLGAAKTSAR